MSFLIALFWVTAGLAIVLVVMSFVGTFMIGSDQAKAARYLAEKYDREHK